MNHLEPPDKPIRWKVPIIHDNWPRSWDGGPSENYYDIMS